MCQICWLFKRSLTFAISSVFLNSPSVMTGSPCSSTSVHRSLGSKAEFADRARRLLKTKLLSSSFSGTLSGLKAPAFLVARPQSLSCHVPFRDRPFTVLSSAHSRCAADVVKGAVVKKWVGTCCRRHGRVVKPEKAAVLKAPLARAPDRVLKSVMPPSRRDQEAGELTRSRRKRRRLWDGTCGRNPVGIAGRGLEQGNCHLGRCGGCGKNLVPPPILTLSLPVNARTIGRKSPLIRDRESHVRPLSISRHPRTDFALCTSSQTTERTWAYSYSE
jgi:hypothetical protein